MPDKERSMATPLTTRLAQIRPNLTWLERMARRFPAKDFTNTVKA